MCIRFAEGAFSGGGVDHSVPLMIYLVLDLFKNPAVILVKAESLILADKVIGSAGPLRETANEVRGLRRAVIGGLAFNPLDVVHLVIFKVVVMHFAENLYILITIAHLHDHIEKLTEHIEFVGSIQLFKFRASDPEKSLQLLDGLSAALRVGSNNAVAAFGVEDSGSAIRSFGVIAIEIFTFSPWHDVSIVGLIERNVDNCGIITVNLLVNFHIQIPLATLAKGDIGDADLCEVPEVAALRLLTQRNGHLHDLAAFGLSVDRICLRQLQPVSLEEIPQLLSLDLDPSPLLDDDASNLLCRQIRSASGTEPKLDLCFLAQLPPVPDIVAEQATRLDAGHVIQH